VFNTDSESVSAVSPTDYSLDIPEMYRLDICRAIEILKTGGCREVFLFGSLTTDQAKAESDIDLAVKGCPKGKFFSFLGQLLLELDHPVDLVNLDSQDAFAKYLEKEGNLLRIG
jgi:predicted nucleotidyltransferase